MSSFNICVDFDGTIVKHAYPEVGAPVPGAVEWMKKWQKHANIILFTMRSGKHLQDAVDYCTSNGINLFGINTNPTQTSWTSSPKAYGNIYIDDAAFGCPLTMDYVDSRPMVDWSEVGPSVMERVKQGTRLLPSDVIEFSSDTWNAIRKVFKKIFLQAIPSNDTITMVVFYPMSLVIPRFEESLLWEFIAELERELDTTFDDKYFEVPDHISLYGIYALIESRK